MLEGFTLLAAPAYLDIAILPNQQVFWLQVAVHQVSLVEVLQGHHHRRNIEACMSLRQRRTARLTHSHSMQGYGVWHSTAEHVRRVV